MYVFFRNIDRRTKKNPTKSPTCRRRKIDKELVFRGCGIVGGGGGIRTLLLSLP